MYKYSLAFFLIPLIVFSQTNQPLQNLASEFYKWRTGTQPITPDDIPRVERPLGWQPDFSHEKIGDNKAKYIEFKNMLAAIDKESFTRADSVDYLLLRSAVERVNWELNILKLPNEHPEFYIHQTVGLVFDQLVISTPMNKDRAEQILLRYQSIPKTINDAKANLTDPIKPFAEITISTLDGIDKSLKESSAALVKEFPDLFDEQLVKATLLAANSMVDYSNWLKEKLPEMKTEFTVGRDNFNCFLKNIALVPFTPEEILSMGKMEWERSVNFEKLEKIRNKDLPEPKVFNSIDEEIEQAKVDEQAIRDFLVDNDLLTIPETTRHYTLRPFPEYVKPLLSFGELDDFTSPTRLDENCVRYIPEPSEDLPYFYRTAAYDPRPLIIHEGVPGHYFQLVQTWTNPNELRRFYFDSNGNEGIGFYVEEMLLQLGLFENMPRTRETIYSFMRLRALRVDVDVNLALGNYTIPRAAKYLEAAVPMDYESAIEGAGFYASTPGQAITYQIGKIQLVSLLSDAQIKLGDKFNLKHFHDYMMQNGNMPISLMRYEYLGEDDQIKNLW